MDPETTRRRLAVIRGLSDSYTYDATKKDASATDDVTKKDVSATDDATKEDASATDDATDDDPSAFDSDEADVLDLAERLQLKTLANLSRDFYKTEPAKEWEDHIPGWYGQGNKRGLVAWAGTSLCHHTVQKGVSFYAQTIGAPPVMTGAHTRHTHKAYKT